jgi:hypothetical protein
MNDFRSYTAAFSEMHSRQRFHPRSPETPRRSQFARRADRLAGSSISHSQKNWKWKWEKPLRK